MTNPMYHIALASDGNYMHLVATCLTSLFATNNGTSFHVHLLSNGIGQDALDEVRRLAADRGARLSVYPIADLRQRLTVDVPPTLAITCYARLFLCSMLPEDVRMVLYIDCDTMFAGNVTPLYATEMGDSLVGGVLDPLLSKTYKRVLDLPDDEPYLNAGILLIPLMRWRKEGMERKFLDFLLARGGNVHHHDQGIINAVCRGRKTIVHQRYNVMSNVYSYPWKYIHKVITPYYKNDEYKIARQSPVILHFTGDILGRPWVEGCSHPYRDKYLAYRACTSYADRPLQPCRLSSMHRMEVFTYRHLPFLIYMKYIQLIRWLSYMKRRFKN